MESVGVQDVEVVETRAAVAAAKDVDVATDDCCRVGPQGRVWAPRDGGAGPVHARAGSWGDVDGVCRGGEGWEWLVGAGCGVFRGGCC